MCCNSEREVVAIVIPLISAVIAGLPLCSAHSLMRMWCMWMWKRTLRRVPVQDMAFLPSYMMT